MSSSLSPEDRTRVYEVVRRHVSAWYRDTSVYDPEIDLERDCSFAQRPCWRELNGLFNLQLGHDIRHEYLKGPVAIIWYIECLLRHPVEAGQIRPPNPEWLKEEWDRARHSST